MAVIKELQDVVDLLGEYDAREQWEAIEALMRILNHLEEKTADSHLSRDEQIRLLLERMERKLKRFDEIARKFGWDGDDKE